MTPMRLRQGEGFTLLEVLVALSILAIGATIALSLISGSLGNIRKVQLRTRTIQHAETVMELSLLDDNIRQPTTLRGDFEDGTRWALTVEAVDMPRPAGLPQDREPPHKLLAYTVEVYSPEARGPDLRLQTLKVLSTQDLRLPAGRVR